MGSLIYRAENMLLEPIHEALRGTQNDVLVCRDLCTPIGAKYTLWVVRNRTCIRTLLELFENMPRELLEGEAPFIARFAEGESMCFLFDYQAPRPLRRFAAGQASSVQERERISIDLVMACLSSPLPFPLLCCLLEQDCVNIAQDGTIYFTYAVDLSQLDPADDETVCTDLCVSRVLDLLEQNHRLKSMKLLHMKLEKSAYQSLTELYRDIRLTVVPERKPPLRKRLKGIWLRNRDRWFRWLLAASVVIVIVTVLVLLSQLIFGDVPLFRLFVHSMDVVGTERLDGRG